MIPGLAVLYLLLLGLAVGGSVWSYRLGRRRRLPFLRTYHLFILLSFAYAVMNFIGEVFAPAIVAGPVESIIRAYLIVDLVTIPLLGGLFFLLFLWIVLLLGRRVPPALRLAFGAVETVFLAVFVTAFVSYFSRGVSILSYWEIIVLDGIIGILLVAAVLVLLFAAPAADDPDRRRLARGLGIAYAVSWAILVFFLAMPRTLLGLRPEMANAVPAGLVFLFNFPALIYLQTALRSLAPRRAEISAEAQGLAELGRTSGISEREKEIARLVASGLGNREIGKRLFISSKTVKNHLTSIYAKTGARNRVQLANLLNRAGGDPEN